ncbi:MAG: hypothetical protein JSR44_16200 [Spirochaetes bacterium]|nr:hypothetical protein [Spirochaetota bacterium]
MDAKATNTPELIEATPTARTSAGALRGDKVSVRSFTFSFALGIFLLVELVLLSSLAVFGYISLKETARQLEMGYSERGREIALSLSAGTLALDQNSMARLSAIFASVVNKNQYLEGERPISEVFILKKDGRVLAHSDISQVTTRTNEAANMFSAKYLDPFYHSSLFYEANNVQQENLPKPEGIFHGKNSFIVDSLMSSDVHYSTDFSVALKETDMRTKKEKSYATLHVLMNRLGEYYYLQAILTKYLLILAIVFLSGFLLSGVVLFAFFLRARGIQREWKYALTYLWENEVIKTEVSHGFQALSGKLNDLEKKVNQPSARLEARPQTDILDAILVEPIK